MKRVLALAVAVLAALTLVAVGCGGGDSTSSEETVSSPDASVATVSDATESTTESTTSDDDIGELDAIKSTITTWLLEGDCDLMTDKFVEAQTFISDREKGCQAFEGGFTPPQYSAEDIEFGDIQYANDRATAIVGGGGSDITSKYKLVFEDDTWMIDAADLQ